MGDLRQWRFDRRLRRILRSEGWLVRRRLFRGKVNVAETRYDEEFGNFYVEYYSKPREKP